MKQQIEQILQSGIRLRTRLIAGKSCDLDMRTWWRCYTGWLSRGGGIGKPDAQYYECKKTCNGQNPPSHRNEVFLA